MIERDLRGAAAEAHDLVIVGGGIHGAVLAAQAARRGLRTLLLERADFGGATSWSSLRILHGGLRYLQSLDLPRLRTSVAERNWFCRTYPDLVEPLECLMPLYGHGLKRPWVFRSALRLNDLLSRDRNRNLPPDLHLPPGRILDAADTGSRIPYLPEESLKGGGVWYDAIMKSSVRVLMEMLRWASANGATLLNYVEACGLESEEGSVAGVLAIDHLTGERQLFRTRSVVNCAGPWCREVARDFDRDLPELFRPSLAFNVLFDRRRLSDCAVAIDPPLPDARAYFIVPWNDKLLAGTKHLCWADAPDVVVPPRPKIREFIDELNLALPGLELGYEEVRRVYAGQVPAEAAGHPDAARAPVVHEHGRHGGPRGLVSVSGVKWTTARDVVERAIQMTHDGVPPMGDDVPPPPFEPELLSNMASASHRPDELLPLFGALADEESVIWLDDLLLRRMEGLDDDVTFAAAVHAGLRVLQGRGISEGEHLARLIHTLEGQFDKATTALRSDFMPDTGARHSHVPPVGSGSCESPRQDHDS